MRLTRMISSNDAAFPSEHKMSNYKGLTKREYFAAKVLQGILANFQAEGKDTKEIVSRAVEIADELIEQLNAKEQQDDNASPDDWFKHC